MCPRGEATHVWTKKYGYRELEEGNYRCGDGEYVQLLDHSMLHAQVVEPSELSVPAIRYLGYYPLNCVSKSNGEWWTLQLTRLDVDFKSHFNLVQVFQTYDKHVGPHYKRSVAIARSGKRLLTRTALAEYYYADGAAAEICSTDLTNDGGEELGEVEYPVRELTSVMSQVNPILQIANYDS